MLTGQLARGCFSDAVTFLSSEFFSRVFFFRKIDFFFVKKLEVLSHKDIRNNEQVLKSSGNFEDTTSYKLETYFEEFQVNFKHEKLYIYIYKKPKGLLEYFFQS